MTGTIQFIYINVACYAMLPQSFTITQLRWVTLRYPFDSITYRITTSLVSTGSYNKQLFTITRLSLVSTTHTWRRSRQVLSIPLAVPQWTLLWRGIRRVGLILHSRWSFPKYWTRWGDALIWLSWRSRWAWEMKLKHTITYLKSDCSKCSDTI